MCGVCVEIDYRYRYHGFGWIGVDWVGWNWGMVVSGVGAFFILVFLCRRKEKKKERRRFVAMFIRAEKVLSSFLVLLV